MTPHSRGSIPLRLTTVIASQRVGAKRRPMTGSAKQSIAPCKERMDCFVASAPRNDVDGHNPAFSRRDPPEVCVNFRALKSEGAGNAGCALHPRSRVQNGRRKRTRAYRFSGGTPTFPAQWLYGLLRTLPGDQDLFVTVAPRMMAGLTPGRAGFASAGLDANLEASGPHDFTVRNSTVRQRAVRSLTGP